MSLGNDFQEQEGESLGYYTYVCMYIIHFGIPQPKRRKKLFPFSRKRRRNPNL